MRPGVAANVSQIDGPRPSTVVEPSTWNAEVAAPHTNPAGKVIGSAGGCQVVVGVVAFGAGDEPSGVHAASRPVVAPSCRSRRRSSRGSLGVGMALLERRH